MIQKELNLIKVLNQKRKDEKMLFEGAVIAFKLPNGETGNWTICNDTGVRLRLIQEGQIQQKIAELAIEDIARKTLLSAAPKPEGGKVGSYLG